MERITNEAKSIYTLKLWPRRLFLVVRGHLLTLLIILIDVCYIENVIDRHEKIMFFKIAMLHDCTFRLLEFTGMGFFLFIFIAYARKRYQNFRWWLKLIFTFLMAWLSAPMPWLPLISAQKYEWRNAAIVTIIFMIVHTFMSMFTEACYFFDFDFFLNWTTRGFVFSSLGIVLSIAWKGSETDVCVAVTVLLYITILIILLGRTMGSEDFYENEIALKHSLFIILNHYNFMTFFSNAVMAFCKIRCILTPFERDPDLDFELK